MFARAICFLVILLASSSAWALECGNRLVERGDYQAEVRVACGNPFWVNDWVEAHVLGPEGVVTLSETVHVSEWYFHFGSNRFMRKLTFHNGRLVNTETLGYGVAGEPGAGRCDTTDLNLGLSMGEIVARCGLPAFRNSWYGTQSVRFDDLAANHVLIRYETWGYDFGPNKFTRYVTFANGRLTNVELGDRGSLHR